MARGELTERKRYLMAIPPSTPRFFGFASACIANTDHC
jgi:hypothetical protein